MSSGQYPLYICFKPVISPIILPELLPTDFAAAFLAELSLYSASSMPGHDATNNGV